MRRLVLLLFAIAALTLPASSFGESTLPGLVRGFTTRIFRDSAGRDHRYILFVPYSFQFGEKLPVIMFLNGDGQNGEDGISQIKNNFGLPVWERRDFFPFLAIAPQCRTGSSWDVEGDDCRIAMQILNSVVQEFDADSDRVCLTGVSSGGAGVWQIGAKHHDRFAAIVPLCGNVSELEDIVKAKLPVWGCYNDGDDPGLVQANRKARKTLIEQGLSPYFIELHQPGHDCWNICYRLSPLYAWISEQRLSRRSAEPIFDYLPPDRLKLYWNFRKLDDSQWRNVDDETLSITPRGKECHLSSEALLDDFDLHLDLWLDERSRCQFVFYPETASQEPAIRIEIVLPDDGCGGVSTSKNGDAASSYGIAAQQSFKPRAWNDVRLRLLQDRLTVQINGWTAADVQIAQSPNRFRVGILVPASAAEVRCRYVRKRALNPSLGK